MDSDGKKSKANCLLLKSMKFGGIFVFVALTVVINYLYYRSKYTCSSTEIEIT